MALRYLASIETQVGAYQRTTAPAGLTEVEPAVDFWLATSNKADVLIAAGGALCIIGTLFCGDVKVRHIPDREASRILSSKGDRLLEGYWGNYVAFVRHAGGNFDIIRDPSGALPCYYYLHRGEILFASDVDCLLSTGRMSPQINWPYMLQRLVLPDIGTAATGLVDVEELLPGFAVELRMDKCDQVVRWSPWRFTGKSGRSVDENAAALEACIDRTVGSLASRHDKVLLGISGGLDSSILAASLAAQTTDFQAVTLSTGEVYGDELSYARSVMDHVARPLAERAWSINNIDIGRSVSGHLPRPIGFPHNQSHDSARREIAGQTGAGAYFTGHGGDNVFCLMSSATPLLDRFLAKGSAQGLWETLNDLCALTGCSYAEAIGMAFQRGRRKDSTYHWKSDIHLLNPEYAAEASSLPMHPWLKAPSDALPGKGVHVAMLMRILGPLEDWARSEPCELVTPLISQPIVELCLGIPTWQWCDGGRDRSVARRAFGDRLPSRVTSRRFKGGPNAFCLDVIETHRRVFHEQLVEGELARRGILDLEAIARIFGPEVCISGEDHLRILELSEIEAWLAHWKSRDKPQQSVKKGNSVHT